MEPQPYFVRVTAGLEQLAWQDIAQHLDAQLVGFGHRRVDFTYAGPPAALLDLRSVDDVYVYVARLEGIDHTRASLPRLTEKLTPIDFAPALAVCAVVRPLGQPPTYRVTASHLGRRNYSRYDVEGAVEMALSETIDWRFVPNDPEEDEPDLDLRMLLEDDWVLIGLRLGAAPLHRRAYKVASRTGSLKAPVAYCLCLLAGLKSEDVVLDLACGAGTILLEAAAIVRSGVIIGGDIDAAALAFAEANLVAAGLQTSAALDALRTPLAPASRSAQPTVLLYQGDAAELPVADHAIRVVITNLPWGKQVALENIGRQYTSMLRTIERVLVAGGRAVLLTDQTESLLAALASCPALRLASSSQISLFGRHPTVYVIDK